LGQRAVLEVGAAAADGHRAQQQELEAGDEHAVTLDKELGRAATTN
jgi:hypothetical protein